MFRTVLVVSFLLLISICSLPSAVPAPAQDDPGKITSLPGADFNITFDQYSGFITVNESHGRKLFYWFVTSQQDPKNDPVVLWLNGGPGCSSLGGFFTELGPFYPLAGGKSLAQNMYSWNKVANVIFLESPSGVGFSYSETTADYKTGDNQTTLDSLQFLIKFFALYPEFANNDFYVTGESYGGHYVPWLSRAVVDYNSQGPSSPINIQGFMVGNAWTDPESDNYGAATFWAQTGIISQDSYNGIVKNCNFSNVGPFIMDIKNPPKVKDACDEFVAEADNEMGPINLYAIYANNCLHTQMRQSDRDHFGQDPCVSTYVSEYLNQQSVKDAIHASESPNTWSDCSGIVDYSRQDLLAPVIPLYIKFFTEKKLRILVYSGDTDGVVPHTGTETWMSTLKLNVKSPFNYWSASNGQVGGWVVHYDEMTYATVRGAGHMVPGTQPLYALDMFTHFLNGKF